MKRGIMLPSSPQSPKSVRSSSMTSDLDSDDEHLQRRFRSSSSAKYLEGSVGMARGGPRFVSTYRDGVLVINFGDGGSLSFYKVYKSNSKTMKTFKCLAESNFGTRGSLGDLTFSSNEDETSKSIFTRGRPTIARTSHLGVGPDALKEIEKVSVFVGDNDFVEPPDMPFLHIPAAVPWELKSACSNFRSVNCFHIIVPPLPNGEMDGRVRMMRNRDRIKNMVSVKKIINNVEFQFASVVKDKDDDDDFGMYTFDDIAGMGGTSKKRDDSSIGTMTSKASKTQKFTFRCQLAKELAVYMAAAQKLNRIHEHNSYEGGCFAPIATHRIRTIDGMEIATQTHRLNIDSSSRSLSGARRFSTIGEEEYRCYPLHAYPSRWMTKKELAMELVRSSKNVHDFRKGTVDEIGQISVEILQCHNLPKMDVASLSDPMCYVICGSDAFLTDVIPDNLNPVWLPLSRRACIFPLYNAYSQIYVGCFDYDGESENDDFIGRVVIDIPRLHSGFTYDITLPLRSTSRVYCRKNLGSIRVRLKLNWVRGERSALLSYFPKKLSDLKKRPKAHPTAVTVACPDAKSFKNIALTIYGKDMPGKFSGGLKTSSQREITMFRIIMIHTAKKTLRDIATWQNPLLSSYIFGGWMHFVISNSVKCVPGFISSLIFFLLLRNYAKYNVNSAAGSMYGHRTLWDFIRILIFDRDDSSAKLSELRKSHNRPVFEVLLLSCFGMSGLSSNPEQSWKYEDHSEFPFSNSAYPKMSSDDSTQPFFTSKGSVRIQTYSYDDSEDDENGTGKDSVDDYLDSDNEDEDEDEEEDESKLLSKVNLKDLHERISVEMAVPLKGMTNPLTKKERVKISPNLGKSKTKHRPPVSVTNFTTKNEVQPFLTEPEVKIPDQNVKTKVKSTKSIHDQISRWHNITQRANLHLFDDRVFLAEERAENEKLLKFNKSRNPLLKKLTPIMAEVLKIFDVWLSAFRAIFNIFMWKDPMLSFWASSFMLFVTIVLFMFPWQKFFFLVGVVGFGPQNWFLNRWYGSKVSSSQSKHSGETGGRFSTANGKISSSSKDSTVNSYEQKDLSNSPLLLRNNVQLKPEENIREIIVPSVPFRYNRFYDWPPDPASTTIH